MDTYGNKTSSLELSLRNQSESCMPFELNDFEKRPNITLKKIGEELYIAETKCLTLKSELNYMMEVCQKAQAEIKGSKEGFNILQESTISSSKSPRSKLPVKYNDDTTHMNPTFSQFVLKKNIDDDDNIRKKTNSFICQTIDERHKGLLDIVIPPRNQSDKKSLSTLTQIPAGNNVIEALRPSFVQTDIKVSELNMNITNVSKTRRTRRSNSTPKIERNDISSVCKTITTISRTRKKKRKLRSFVSKSTVTTKYISFTNKKDVKRHRHKAQNLTMSHNPYSIPIKHSKKIQEIVEIFRNTTLKNSNSGLSSKYSKLSKQAKMLKKQHIININVNKKIQDQLPSEQIDHKNQCYNKETSQSHLLSHQNNPRIISENVQQQNKFNKSSINSSTLIQKSKLHQYKNGVFNKYNDPTFTPSYEMPTLASRLKRSNKSYFSRFNFRNIPFVVGTSVTPSHNLGLNIQQVLSVMKMRQPLANDIASLLIQKVGRSTNPVLNFLEQINNQCKNSFSNSNQEITGTFNNKVNLSLSKNKKFSILDLQNVEKTQNVYVSNISDNAKLLSEKDNTIAKQPFKEKKDEHRSKRQFSSIINTLNLPAHAEDQREISGKVIHKHKIGNYNAHISVSRNSKEIRDILTNIHNQFEEMNRKYEKLLSEVEKSNDKSIAKELSVLEKELSVKEEEINTMLGLYKEVIVLKQQMKILRKQKSPLCIELAKDISCKNLFPITILSGKSQLINPTEIFDRRIFSASRKQPAAIELAVLLRQIQTFYKQLQLIS